MTTGEQEPNPVKPRSRPYLRTSTRDLERAEPPWAELWNDPKIAHALATRDISAIYRYLQARGITQRYIGMRTGQAQSDVSSIISGRSVVNYEVLARIATGLKIPRGRMGLAYEPDVEQAPYAARAPYFGLQAINRI